ncbi:MAG: amidase family protein, partial [Actinomycetota bacterium]|nr:amidase family protein [Actinomycetota bacterium]
ADLFATQASHYQPDVRDKLWAAMQVPGWRYIWSRAHAVTAREEVSASLASCDAVVLPTVPIVAPGLHDDEIQIRDIMLRNTRPASLTGHTAISIPLPTGGGLPVGLQVIAADDRRAFRVARWIEQVLAARS